MIRTVTSPLSPDLTATLQQKFQAFFIASPKRQGRRFPEELKGLVCHAYAVGYKVPAIAKLTQVSHGSIAAWVRRGPKVVRRLRVVRDEAPIVASAQAILRFPSGAMLEIADVALLERLLFSNLGGE